MTILQRELRAIAKYFFCSVQLSLAKPLAELRAVCGPDFPLIADGHIGYADEAQGWINTDAESPESFLQFPQTWSAQILGGYGGARPEHIRRLCVVRDDTT